MERTAVSKSARTSERRIGPLFVMAYMTTLLITEVFPPQTGGSGRWFWEIYRRLPRAGVLIAAGQYAGHEAFDRTHDVRLIRLPLALGSWGLRGWRNLRDYWRPVWALRRLVRSEGICAVHCGKCLPEGLMALALKCLTGVPYICFVHGEEMKFTTTSRELTWLTRLVIRSADFLIANSRNTAHIIHDVWATGLNRVRVLSPGVDADRFCPGRETQRFAPDWVGLIVPSF